MVNKLRWLLWPQIGLVIFITVMAYLDKLPGDWLAWPYSDKVLHFVLFGMVAFWLRFWQKNENTPGHFRGVPVMVLLGVIFIEEGLQSLSPHRSVEVADMLSDLLGVLFLWTLAGKISKWPVRA